MTEWKEFKIYEVSDIMNGGTPSTSTNQYWNGNIPWLTPRDLTGYIKTYISQGERNISEDGLRNSSARMLPEGTVLLSSRAPIGYIAIAKNPLTTNQGFKNFVVKSSKLNNLFLFYWLKNNTEYLQSLGTGTTFAEINKSTIENIPILLPPLPEQKAIASVLSSLDDKIDLLHRQNKTLEAMAEALFRQWFIEEADEKWEEVELSKYADNIRDNVSISNLNLHENYVGLEHIPRKQIILNSWSTPDSLESNKSEFKKGDILFGKLRSYFHKVVFSPLNGICSTDILVIRPKSEKWFAFCLFWFFNTNVVDHSDLGAGGTRMPRTNWEIVSSYRVPDPPEELINQFNKIVMPMIKKMEKNIFNIRTLEKLRDTLLPKLMSGEVRVKI